MYQDLVHQCKHIQTIEVELFHHQYRRNCGWIIDTETVESLRANIMVTLGNCFPDTVTKKLSPVCGGTFNNEHIHDEQLEDYKLVYKKKKPNQTP